MSKIKRLSMKARKRMRLEDAIHYGEYKRIASPIQHQQLWQMVAANGYKRAYLELTEDKPYQDNEAKHILAVCRHIARLQKMGQDK